MMILTIAIMILSHNAGADAIPLSPTLECHIDKNSNTLGMRGTITLALDSNAITILNQATGLVGKRQDQRLAKLNMPARPKNMAFYAGLTLWAAPYYQETYAGNGIEDMEIVVLASKKLLPKSPNRQGQLIFLATGEEGELLESVYTCTKMEVL